MATSNEINEMCCAATTEISSPGYITITCFNDSEGFGIIILGLATVQVFLIIRGSKAAVKALHLTYRRQMMPD